MSELISEGMTPLIRAVELFDVGLGNRFSTYATWAVRNQMLRMLKRVRQRVEFTVGDNAPPLESLSGRSEAPESDGSIPQAHQRVVGRLLSSLSDRERAVVAARFGLEGHPHGQSLAIIASQVGLCKERVRQILSQALLKLKSQLTVDELDSVN
jgi:RNA polymerase sigma factor (sigma-70 family)